MHQNKEDAVNKKLCGAAGFNRYYQELYGSRWELLRTSLLAAAYPVVYNPGGKKPYCLDRASIAAAASLPLSGAGTILDLCAAPGGKTLILASLMDSNAVLVANERSAARKQRLTVVCADCLPSDIRMHVRITCSDGARWCLTQHECYDRILLDAPCSSERHVLANQTYLDQWSPARIKTVAMEQWALLSSAFRLLVPGGFLLYSTCALTPAENDDMVERLLKKFENASSVFNGSMPPVCNEKVASFCTEKLPVPELTKYGAQILPDRQSGSGPLYYSLLTKT